MYGHLAVGCPCVRYTHILEYKTENVLDGMCGYLGDRVPIHTLNTCLYKWGMRH